MTIRLKLFLSALLLFPFAEWAQVSNPSVLYQTSAPSGACSPTPPIRVVDSTGTLYTCDNGTWAAAGGGGGGGASVSTEFILSGAGSQTFAHNLNSEYPFAFCYTKSGSQWGVASLTPVDANDITFTSAGATDTVCNFSAGGTIAQDFAFTVSPTSETYVTSMSGTQTPTFAIAQSALNGYSGTATYSCTNLAGGMSCGYSPTTITGSGSSTLSLSFPSTQASATTDLNASATDGTRTHTQPIALTVANTNANLVEGWPATDGTGTSFANPITGNTITGISGGSWGTVTGLGEAYTFAGTGMGTATNDTNTNFTGTTPFSISVCTYFTGLNYGQAVVGSFAATTLQGWGIFQQNANELTFALFNNSSSNLIQVATTAANLVTDTKYQIGVTYDGSQTAAGVIIYVNGVAQSVTVEYNDLSATTANGLPLQVGGSTNISGYDLSGAIGALRIYNAVVSAGTMVNLATGCK